MGKEIWQIKNGYGKVVFETKHKSQVATISSFYNSKTKLQTQNFTLSNFTYSFFKNDLVDINNQNHKGGIFTKSKNEHPLAIKDYDKKHEKYRKEKEKLCEKLVYNYHYWGYAKSDNHKLCGFDF